MPRPSSGLWGIRMEGDSCITHPTRAVPPCLARGVTLRDGCRYLALEIVRQAPERVTHFALLSTHARADSRSDMKLRRDQIKTAKDEGMHRLGLHLTPLVYPRLQEHHTQP